MNYSDSEKSAIVAEYKQGIPIKGLSIKYEISNALFTAGLNSIL